MSLLLLAVTLAVMDAVVAVTVPTSGVEMLITTSVSGLSMGSSLLPPQAVKPSRRHAPANNCFSLMGFYCFMNLGQ
jgi:hypothetical protein